MVLESLTNPLKAEKRPAQMILLGALYTSVAFLLSLWIFLEYSSLIAVFFIVFACVPIVYNTIRLEEKKDERETNEIVLLKEHSKALMVFMFLFLGITITVAIWYIFLPTETVSVLFSTQTDTFHSINGNVVGMATFQDQMGQFSKIFLNNFKVMLFCLLFSFIYGIGAIFILTWNATVIGVAIGMTIRKALAGVAASSGLVKVAAYFQIFTYGFLRYAIHGVFEILAYFVAGLAGGIISIAIIRHNFGTNKFERILWDATDLILASLVILVLAGVLEVWVTPLIF
jgi:uncharacterized membrane protein SpoIIM required for sporulation